MKDNLSEIAPVKDGESIASALNDPIYGNDVNIASDLIQRLEAVYLMDDLALMINEIKNIEAETMELFDIENNPNMMATTILGTSSVLRHSLYYWHEYNELHPGAQGDWNKIGNADASSFVKAATTTLVGAGIPAVAVSMVNPWAILAGWGIATVVGSAFEAGNTWGWW